MSIQFYTPYFAEEYLKYRVTYPSILLKPAWEFIKKLSQEQICILDLGCGTGEVLLSSKEFIKNFNKIRKWIHIDRDEAMLKEAMLRTQNIAIESKFEMLAIEGVSHLLQLENSSVDFVFIASAFHWMKLKETAFELQRVLKPGGAVFILEYQFPKLVGEGEGEFNENVRRLFNTEFKAPGQTPRGTLKKLVNEAFLGLPAEIREFSDVSWIESLSGDRFMGLLLSQSRAIHAMSGLGEDEKAQKRNELKGKFVHYFKPLGTGSFSFKNKSFLVRF